MNDFREILRDNLIGLWRRRWQALIVAWIFCLAGWFVVATLPPQYAAKARIYVDTDSMLRPLLRGIAIDSNLLNEVDLMQRTLLSRPNIQRVARMADLDIGAKTPTDQESLVLRLQRQIKVASEGRNLFSLTYEGTDPQMARNVVQSLITIFVESNVGASRRDLVAARGFIDDQIRDYERQLDQAEKKLADFKAANLGFLPGEGNFFTRLELSRAELARTVGELEETRKRRDELKRQIENIPSVIETVNTGPLSGFGPPLGGPFAGGPAARIATGPLHSITLTQRVSDLEQRLSLMELRYTERHPDVIEAKRLLEQSREELKTALAEEKKQAQAASGPGGLSEMKITMPNPVYEQLQLQLVQAETQVASLENRLERNQSEVKRWDELGRSVPNVAAELSKLTRDYDVIKRNYEEFRSRREAAKIGESVEAQTKSVQFRIIEPPTAPAQPTGPNRYLFNSLVLLGGLAAGVVFALFMSQIDGSIRHIEQLKQLIAVPVLGSVSMIHSIIDRRRRSAEIAGFGLAAALLLVVYVGLVSVPGLLGLRA